jgi:FHS family L-fucose permease-like MFS transporter
MGYVADKFDMSRGFIVPMFCFGFVAFYGFNWPRFSNADGLESKVEALPGASAVRH